MSAASAFWLSNSSELYHAGFVSKHVGGSTAPLVLTTGGQPVSLASLVQQAAGLSGGPATDGSNVHDLGVAWESAVALDVASSQVTLSVREVADGASAPKDSLSAVATALKVCLYDASALVCAFLA